MPESLQKTFEDLWDSRHSPPDIFQFLTSRADLEPDELATVVRIDQQHRWKTDAPLHVEHYFAPFPQFRAIDELVLELIAGEFLARLQNNQCPQIDEYMNRFPELHEQLLKKLSGLSSTNAHSGTALQPASIASKELMEIDEICDRFESAWNSDTNRPLIEHFLRAAPEHIRPALLKELLRTELCCRNDQGENPTLEEYRSRFPADDPIFKAALHEWKLNPNEFLLFDRSSSASALKPAIGNSSEMAGSQSSSSTLDGIRRIEHFRLVCELGHGDFGRVYRAYDEQLDRAVAIKVPRKSRFKRAEDAELYLAEARMAARLEHPQIVSVYQTGRIQDGSVYLVSQLIEGCTLKDLIEKNRPELRVTVSLTAQVARALHYAHQHRLIHRDIKPANILIEESTGTPFVADFGLAMKEEDYLKQVAIIGSPAYMSPEQARAEGHRLDGRSDVFSLGVVLYEMLTGEKPFRGSSVYETLHQVISVDPRPPRSIEKNIPVELERICLKAISKKASDRYGTAKHMAEDLDAWLQPATPSVTVAKTEVQVTPKGLRSFDASDADFFLDLLPGPRNRDGLPESIAFWKQRIEETDPEKTFSVGLIYGPSGCGKSSMVKAGLLPHLSKDVIAIYLEATPEETEFRILRGMRKRIPDCPEDIRLVDALLVLRRGVGFQAANADSNETACGKPTPQKVVIIIDQFEQWLHAHRPEPNAELVKALRQCNGVRVQAIVMIRDDFAMAAARFMNALDVPIVQGENFATIDLFEIDHAKNVLIKFGQAFGKLPAKTCNLSADEQQFVGNVATGLSHDGNVVPVRLALFAEMVKRKPWTMETLQQVGGTEGIGVNFLEETFSSPQANPRHRLQSVAARAVLRSLLPELGSNIKGHMRSQQELQEASGYANRHMSGKALAAGADDDRGATTPMASAIPLTTNPDFNDLLRILDSELRLITPTDPEGDSLSDSPRNSSLATRYYQLTHDYLVPSLREWLTRKQKETRRGRAELKLEERSALWNAQPENRHLPSLPEWFRMRWLTESNNWTPQQKKMMGAAGRRHCLQSFVVLFVTCVLMATGIGLKNQAEAKVLVEGLLSADTGEVSGRIDRLRNYRRWADSKLKQAFANSPEGSRAKLHAALALVGEGQTVDPVVIDFLRERLLTVEPDQLSPVRTLLAPHRTDFVPAYWKLVIDEEEPTARRFHAACALAAFDPDSTHHARRDPTANPHAELEAYTLDSWNNPAVAEFVAEQLVTVSPVFIDQYRALLRPVAPSLVPALSRIFRTPSRGELIRNLATRLLADYAAKDPDTLTELVLAADADSDKSLFPVLQQHRSAAVNNLEAVLERRLEPDWKDAPSDPAWTEPSAAVRAQIETVRGLITDRFAFCQDMPLPEFLEFAEALRTSGYRPTRIRPYAGGSGRVAGDGRESLDTATNSSHALPASHHPIIAAIWTRDSKRWHLDPSLKKAELPAIDTPASKDDLLLTDLAPLPASDPTAETEFIAVWCEPEFPSEQRRIVLDATGAEFELLQTERKDQGLVAQRTISVRTDSNNVRRYTGIWSSHGAPSELLYAYAGHELVRQPQWDVAVAPAGKLADPVESFRQQLTEIEKLPAKELDDPKNRETRAAAQYQMGNLDQALADLDFLISKGISTPSVLQYRTLALVRLSRAEETKQSLEKYLATDANAAFKSYVQIQVSAWLGDFEQASAQLESAVTASGQNTDDLYNAARAAARLFEVLSAKDAAQSTKFADRTIELLQQIVALGFNNAEQLKSDPDFANLHDDPRFTEVLSQIAPPARYAALWRADVDTESKLLASVPVDHSLEQLKPLLAQGYRPFAIAVDPNPVPSPLRQGEKVADKPDEVARGAAIPSSPATQHSPPSTHLVLHRPIIPDAAKENLALQQAAAATTLLRLNAPEKVWPLFQDQPDPRLQCYLLNRLAKFSVDPQALLTQLDKESSSSYQRSLILGIGEFARAKPLSTEQRTAAVADLATRLANDLKSGVHGAAEWTLRQLGAKAAIEDVRSAYSTGEPVGDRSWYLTRPVSDEPGSSGMTLAVIEPDEFLMGSPVTEADRALGSAADREARHRHRIGHRYAIGMYEVTIEQFRAFRKDHWFDRRYADADDAPANMISWFDAAAFCNWLSEKQGFPRNQWCYDPDQPFEAGMTLPIDFLQRTGYRLPSEAEWEYACRAGTVTSRYFGESEALIGDYAWYTTTSGDKSVFPVGMLQPNAVGLFDMYGNIAEWCQDEVWKYDKKSEWLECGGELAMLNDVLDRINRGNSFGNRAPDMRSALRESYRAVFRTYNLGFRVARTMPPVARTATPANGGVKIPEN